MSPVFENSAKLLNQLTDSYKDSDDVEDQWLKLPFKLNTGDMSLLVPLILSGKVSIEG